MSKTERGKIFQRPTSHRAPLLNCSHSQPALRRSCSSKSGSVNAMPALAADRGIISWVSVTQILWVWWETEVQVNLNTAHTEPLNCILGPEKFTFWCYTQIQFVLKTITVMVRKTYMWSRYTPNFYPYGYPVLKMEGHVYTSKHLKGRFEEACHHVIMSTCQFLPILANFGKRWKTFANFWQLLATLDNFWQKISTFASFPNFY